MDLEFSRTITALGTLPACALVKPQLEEGMTDGQILRAVHRCAEELFRLHQENDSILREVLFSKTPESLTEEELLRFVVCCVQADPAIPANTRSTKEG